MAEETASEEVEAVDPLRLFPEEWQAPITGLAFLGQLTDEVIFCGHRFVLRTLLPQDRFAIGSVIQPYRGTLVEVDVYQSAHIGLSLMSIDNDEDFCPPRGPDIETFTKGRLNWIGRNLYPPAIAYLWTVYDALETKASGGMAELDRLLKGSQPITLPPWLDSLTEQGSSPEEIDSDSQPYIPSNSPWLPT